MKNLLNKIYSLAEELEVANVNRRSDIIDSIINLSDEYNESADECLIIDTDEESYLKINDDEFYF